MAWFRKKKDPITDRTRALNDEIAALEAQIKTLDSRLQRQDAQPRLRSTALPQDAIMRRSATQTQNSLPLSREPIFEEVDIDRLQRHGEPASTAAHYNELGVRKYDLTALFRRIRNHFRGLAASNPRLVSYLAAGGI